MWDCPGRGMEGRGEEHPGEGSTPWAGGSRSRGSRGSTIVMYYAAYLSPFISALPQIPTTVWITQGSRKLHRLRRQALCGVNILEHMNIPGPPLSWLWAGSNTKLCIEWLWMAPCQEQAFLNRKQSTLSGILYKRDINQYGSTTLLLLEDKHFLKLSPCFYT